MMIRHPGQILLEEYMTPLNLNPSQLAKGLGLNRSTVGRLIAGEHRLTSEMAACLGAFFQVPARWWLTMQAEFDAQEISEHLEWVEGVTPMEPDPDLLLTPTGVLHLGPARAVTTAPPSLSSVQLEALPEVEDSAPREVQTVRYANGATALVGSS